MDDQVCFQREEGWTDEGWTSIPNRVLRDDGLSWEARGMFAYLASHSPKFRLTQKALAAAGGSFCGRDKTRRIMEELVAAGYVSRQRLKDGETGRLGTWHYTLHSRRSEPVTENPSLENPRSEPVTDYPATAEPALADQSLIKKTISKKTNKNMSGVSDAAPVEEFRPDVEKICGLLHDRIVENGSKPPSINKQWRDEARRMIDRDQRDFDEIVRLIDWCQQDEFWKRNILSMPKFRAQYDRLRLGAQARRTAPRAAVQTRTPQPGVRYCEV